MKRDPANLKPPPPSTSACCGSWGKKEQPTAAQSVQPISTYEMPL